MATGEMVTAGAPSEDLCGRKGTGSGAVARGLVVKPITVDLHREWHRPYVLYVSGEFGRLTRLNAAPGTAGAPH
jgi:hypothetical protein